MPLTRLDNLISSKTGKYLYVSPDDYNASDALDNRGNSPLRPFVTIQRAFLEAARFSYLPNVDNDRFDQFTIMLSPGNHYIDNRPGISDVASLPVFQFNQTTQEWEANSNVSFDLSDPDNILYKFNGRDGGATIPRGTSLVGTDLRRTQVRALYVPDPADKDIARTSLFNVTGGCYFWQFTILDGDLEASSPLYNVGTPVGIGKVYTQPNNTTNLAIPEFSHHKITNFVFADKEDLGLLYRKISRVFSDYQPAIDDVYVEGSSTPVTESWVSGTTYNSGDRVIYGKDAYVANATSTNVIPGTDASKWNLLVIRGREFDYRIQENRIVGPLSDAIRLDSIKVVDSSGLLTVTVRTKINHGFFPGQYVAITNNGLNTSLNGVFKVSSISQTDPKEFNYVVPFTAQSLNLTNGTTYTSISSPALDTNATVQAEVDSVESASPYVFNCSIRSTWGICGIWADGRKATGFKSMVIAQYTGVSLQKDDRAFIRYDEFSNTWNQAPLTDAFATTPYHIKGDAYWKDDWRNFHVRASDDSFIQNVSIFAVGFADHFLLESGGDMSITNSNSNFGNTSMHSKGYKGFAFNQDKGGYITDIIPPKSLSTLKVSKQQYYTLDVALTRGTTQNPNSSKLYIGSDDARDPEDRPAATISGYRIGARRNEKLYVKLDTTPEKVAEISPSGFKKWTAALTTLTPSGSRSVEDATTLYVVGTAGFLVNDIVRVDDEYFKVNTVNATSLVVTRAQLGSISAEHLNASTVTRYISVSPSSSVVNEIVDATETVLTLQSTVGFTPNMFVSLTNNQTSVSETVRVISVEGNDIVVERGQLGTVAIQQPVNSVVTATVIANTYSASGTTTTLTEKYPRIIPASNASQRDYNLAQDAANLIDANKAFIQSEAFGYILEKYPYLQNRAYINPNIEAETGRYRDASNLIKANRQEIIEYAYAQMQTAFPTFVVPNGEKCKRDIGYIIDAISSDLYDGGNAAMIEATKSYFDSNGALITNGVLGEQAESIFAFNRVRDWSKKAISNLLTNKTLLNVLSITSSGTTVTVTTNNAHNLTAGDKITVGGARQTAYNGSFTVLSAGLTTTQFRYTASATPSATPATGSYYISTVTIDPVNDDPGVGRFKDAYSLISLNREEIVDRAYGEIALQYDEGAWGTNWIVPGDSTTTNLSRYFDAYRLIQQNKAIIVETAYKTVNDAPPSPAPANLLSKCKRDISYFVDAVTLDLLSGTGNKYTRLFLQQYFSGNSLISNGLAGEITQSNTAFNKARDAMKAAVTNTLSSVTGLVTTNPVGGSWFDGTTGTKTIYTDLTITAGPATFGGGGGTIANNNATACADVRAQIDTLTSIVTTNLTAGNLTGLVSQTTGISEGFGEIKCKRDIGYIVDSIAQDLFWGGNEFTVTAVREYFNLSGTPLTNGLLGETTQSVIAFNAAREMVKKAITNQLYNKNLNISAGPSTFGGGGGNISVDQSGNSASCADVQTTVNNLFAIVTDVVSSGTLNNLPSVNNGLWDCANVRNTIDTLTKILTTSLASGNLNELPVANPGKWSQISEDSKCKRDIGYMIEAVTSDLRLGSNENTINAAEAYYTAIPFASDTNDSKQDGFTLDYIEQERTETLDAYNYVRNLAISAMRNHNTYINNASTTNGSSIVTVASTVGLAVGMRVRSVDAIPTSSSSVVNFTTTIPSVSAGDSYDTYIKKIGDGQNGLNSNQIQLGTAGSKLDSGVTVNARATSSTVKLYVELLSGSWSNAVNPITDAAVIQDYNYLTAGAPASIAPGATGPGGECSSVANSIVNYFTIVTTIINGGVGTIPRVSTSINTGSLAQRGTLFTLIEYDSNNNPTTNPHDLETGTPVRLVPRARRGTNPDKRVIRLPKGFDSNTIYYTISPGRKTDPFDYSNSVGFNGANQQNLMLATSEENAAAGIYIYSSETDSIDSDVEIDVYQYVLDINYDLHQYQTKIAKNSSVEFETDRPHIFDKPSNNVTPQKVFFRVGSDIVGSTLPTLSSTFGGTTLSGDVEYYARYVSSTRFTIHQTFANARDNLNPVTFAPGSTSVFYTFANKKRSPLRYDATIGTTSNDGCWYLETLSATNTIIPRLALSDYSGRVRTTDTYYERVEDTRTKEDRVYRLRYVIPKNLKTARDPLRGFVLKIRTDEKRRLLPQKILLKPTGAGASLATFNAPTTGERLGLTLAEQTTLNPNFVSTYDPGPQGNPKRVSTYARTSFTIQSARKRKVGDKDYLEMKVFDIGIDDEAFKTKLFTTVKLSSPEGGNGAFTGSLTLSDNTNKITWTGNSSGSAYVHAYFEYENQYYAILRDFDGNSVLEWSSTTPTVFTQGSVTAILEDNPNGGRSDIDNFLYVVEGANVYTLTPGDQVIDDNGVSYTIAEVEDVSDFESTFYIFDINTIRRRIPGQQDGIYYLTCLRGDIRPFPTGAGVGENFRNFKFSQPVSKLYPEFYKNDPEWYKGIDGTTATLLDPPATISAADNYVHGLVTVNDSKGSVTKEMVLDFVGDPGSGQYVFTGTTAIQAQSGSASAGSEGRKIPISGTSVYPTEGKLYVELRRPSIARSGNHTFEYLGFGPGNYSTGFPARQEIILTDTQDFYAQAKREDAGIVFYTGLNSNGDLYIGNRKINAITGEETFLEKAVLVESSDEGGDDIGGLVTTFDTPVTFNEIITINGGGGGKESFFNSPVVINNSTAFGTIENYPSLVVKTGQGTAVGYDTYLERNILDTPTGDIVIHQNRISAAVFDFNPRGTQDYTIRTSISNITPDTANTFGTRTGGPSQVTPTNFGTRDPLQSGDILLKGSQTLFTGSLAWIYANDYISLRTTSGSGLDAQIAGIQGSSSGSIHRINWYNTTNDGLTITTSSQIRITGATGSLSVLNGVWSVSGVGFSGTNSYVDIETNTTLAPYPLNQNNGKGYPVDVVAQPTIVVARSQAAFKEVGVIGAEAIRTETATVGDYKLGINTIARSAHSAYETAFVSNETTPRANLDVVGTTFITGKKINSYLTEGTTVKTETGQVNGFLVGGNSLTPNLPANLRVDTLNGRVGVNTSINDTVNPTNNLDRSFVVVGNGRITSDFEITGDLQVNGGDITTTSTTFNLINTTANILNVAGSGQILNLLNNTTSAQNINIGNNTASQSLLIGNVATQTVLRIHRNSNNASVDIATVRDIIGNVCDIKIGGAWLNTDSKTLIGTRQTILSGELEIGNKYAPGTSSTRIFAQTRTVNVFDGAQTTTVNLALNASELNLGSSGGFTTVRNTLKVLASANVEGNIKLNGGLNAGIITIQRARFSTAASGHVVGSTVNPNIDFYKYESTGRVVDTQGVALWGSAEYLVAGGQIAGIDNINNIGGANRIAGVYPFLTPSGGTGTGAQFTITINSDKSYLIDIISAGSGYTDNDLLTITNAQLGGGSGGGNFTFQVNGVNAAGTNYYLPISTPSQFDFKIGDYVLLDRGNASSPDTNGSTTGLRNQAYSEILRVVGLTNLTNPNDPKGYRIEVVRAQDGTTQRTDHPDGCVIAKLNKQSAASYITGADLDANGVLDVDGNGNPIGVPTGTSNINIGVAEFGGTLTTNDYLRLSGGEIVKIFATVSTDIQSLIINDGGSPAATTFKVESTTGNTTIFGNLGVGSGFNKFTVDSNSGNTTVAGTLTTEGTLTINGSTLANTQYFKITNGGATGTPLRTTFQIDTSNGNVVVNGGNINVYGSDGTTPRLTFTNSSGDFTTYGAFSALGSGTSRFGGAIQIGGAFGTTDTSFPYNTSADLTINGGDLTINSGANEIFKVANDGAVKLAKINNYFTRTGGRKWLYSDAFTINAEANVNYFVNAVQNTLFKLPQNPLIGDMIRIIDVGGNLTYNLSLIIRAPDGVKVQNASDNTARNLASGIPVGDFTGYNGGEMVVQTPYAAFALVFAGSTTPEGTSAVPSSIAGWYLIEV